MLDYFYVSFQNKNEKIGNVVLKISNWEEALIKILREYLINQDLKELDVKIKKYNVLTNKIENQTSKIEVS